jgi:hypothetical protein
MIIDKFVQVGISSKNITYYRKKGYNVYLLNQNNKLPFYFTREDILITKNFYELNQSQ